MPLLPDARAALPISLPLEPVLSPDELDQRKEELA